VGCYLEVVQDLEDKTCVNARVNGKPFLLPIEELEKTVYIKAHCSAEVWTYKNV